MQRYYFFSKRNKKTAVNFIYDGIFLCFVLIFDNRMLILA